MGSSVTVKLPPVGTSVTAKVPPAINTAPNPVPTEGQDDISDLVAGVAGSVVGGLVGLAVTAVTSPAGGVIVGGAAGGVVAWGVGDSMDNAQMQNGKTQWHFDDDGINYDMSMSSMVPDADYMF